MLAKYQKLINLNIEEKEGLEKILREIQNKGGKISMMSLITDSIRIYINNYGNEAIEKYSTVIDKKEDDKM